MKGAKKIFGANALDKGADKIIDLLIEIGKEDLEELKNYLSRGLCIEKKLLKLPLKKLIFKLES